MVWEPHSEGHSSVRWVVLEFVTVENVGKRGLLTEGDFGRVHAPVMEARRYVWPVPRATACPLPFSESADAPSAFPLKGLGTGCSVDFLAQAPSLCVTGFMTTPVTGSAGPWCLLFGHLWQMCTVTWSCHVGQLTVMAVGALVGALSPSLILCPLREPGGCP